MSKVTVIGAGNYGSTTAYRVATMDIVDEVVMTDIVEGLPEGLALDMNQSAPIEGFHTRVVGQSDGFDQTANSEVVVITAGLPRKPGMSRMDLIETNAKIVGSVTAQAVEYSPNAVIVVVSNPLDEMTALAHRVSGFPTSRVIGQAGMLDSARLRTFIAWEFGVSHTEVEAFTLGSHGDTMVPVPSMSSVSGKPLTEIADVETIDALVERTRAGGAEVVGLLKKGSAYYAPASSAAAMVRAIVTDSREAMPVCAWVDDEYGISDVYLGVTAILGRGGVIEIVEHDLDDTELTALRAAADAVREKQATIEELS